MATMVWRGKWEDHTIEIEMLSEKAKAATKYQYRLVVDCRELLRERRVGWQNLVVLRKQTAIEKGGEPVQLRAEIRIRKGGSEADEHRCRDAVIQACRDVMAQISKRVGFRLVDPNTRQRFGESEVPEVILEQMVGFDIEHIRRDAKGSDYPRSLTAEEKKQIKAAYQELWPQVEAQQKLLAKAQSYSLLCALTVDDEAVELKREGEWFI